MIEMRWVWHNFEHGIPPSGAVCVDTDGRLYQKLQYRQIAMYGREWGEWIDVPHSGVMHPKEHPNVK